MDEIEIKILSLLQSKPFKMFKSKEIARHLDIPQNSYHELRAVLRDMAEEGRLARFKTNRFGAKKKQADVTGILHVNTQGYGFVIREDGQDIFVSQKNMGLALHKDYVRVRLFASTQGKSLEGEIVEVIKRARTNIVGTLRHGRRYDYVVPDDIKIQRDLIIPPDNKAGALEGQKVVAVIEEWENSSLNPVGKIIQVLGFSDHPGVDVLSILHAFDLPDTFPEYVIKAVDKIPSAIPAKEAKRRLDLRDIVTFTIDPIDAKDFDDAVSCVRLANGHFHLGVHIADVSYYVSEMNPVDIEAAERGTSVYLVDRVVPMLPEKLSNELCSLKENEEKLCLSVLMELAPDGELVNYDFHETLIKSRKRFNYEQAHRIMQGEEESDYKPVLMDMLTLSKALIRRRKLRGGVDFQSEEIQIDLDEKGVPVGIRKRERLDSHRLVEEFMLLANETVAQHIGAKNDLTFVYRIHEKPEPQNVEELLRLAGVFGIVIKSPKKITPKFFQKLSDQFQTGPLSFVLNDALLHTMMKARYSTQNCGHFGLAYKYYTHFTSPIRRYPDLMVHRLLKRYCIAGKPGLDEEESERLENACIHSTHREIRAQEAERASVKMKQIEFMEKYLSYKFDGIISRIVKFGFFVRVPQFLLDGLVHVSTLEDDYYIYDEQSLTLNGKNHHKKYRLGDSVTVAVERVNRNEHLVDFILVKHKRNA
jgi:ribonuclease R